MKKTIAILGITAFIYSSAEAIVAFSRVKIDSALNAPHGVWAGDIDGTSPQCQSDAFATIASNHQVVWYENFSLGMVWGAQNIIYTSDRFCTDVSAADLDLDGILDAVSSHTKPDTTSYAFLAVHKNNGGGTFTTTTLDTIKARLNQIRLTDINNDGRIDIVVAASTVNPLSLDEAGLYWYENNGSMNFTRHFIGACNVWKLDCFDGDGDGHLDIVANEECFGSNSTLPARLLLYKNNGATGFTQIVIDNDMGLHLGDPAGGAGVRCADFDWDGKVDIIAGSGYYGKLYLYVNNGGGSFTKNLIDTSASKTDGIDIGDFEGDGDMDIVACGRNSWIKWYENNGNRTFTAHHIDIQYSLFDQPFVTYLDGDSCPDLLVTEASSSTGNLFAYLNSAPAGSGCNQSVKENKQPISGNWMKAPAIVNKNSTEITFGIKTPGNIKLIAFDISGKLVDVIIDNQRFQSTGSYKVNWSTKEIPSGIYFVKLTSVCHSERSEESNTINITKKLILMK